MQVDAHVREAPDHVKHVVRVHGGEHQMPGKRRLHRDAGGFRIADFTDHDLVRVVAQQGAQAARKGQALALVHRNLQHPRQLILDRVFDRHQLFGAGIDFGEHRIQCGGLAATGRAGHQQHAVGLARQAAQFRQRRAGIAERFERKRLERIAK